MSRDSDPRTIASDERLFDLTEHLYQHGSAGVTELANACGISKSTVHGHLSTLLERGYALKDDDASYRLSLQFLGIGAATQRAREIYDVAKPRLREVADQTGEKVWCIVEENGEAVLLEVADGEHAVPVTANVGDRTDLYRLAGSKAILANLPKERRRSILDGYEYPIGENDRQLSRSDLEDELGVIRERGVAFNEQAFANSIRGIGSAVITADGRVCGAISIGGPKKRLERPQLESEYIELLISVTSEVGVDLSYR